MPADGVAKQSFKTKLQRSIIKNVILVVLVPLLAFWLFGFTYNYFSEKVRNSKANQDIFTQLQDLYSRCMGFFTEMEGDELLYKLMRGEGNSVLLYEKIYRFVNQKAEHDTVFIADMEQNVLYGNLKRADYNTLDFLQGKTLFSILDEKVNEVSILTFYDRTRRTSYHVLGKCLKSGEQKLGYLCLVIDPLTIEEICRGGGIDFVVVLDQYRNVIYTNAKETVNFLGKFDGLDDSGFYGTRESQLPNGITVITAVTHEAGVLILKIGLAVFLLMLAALIVMLLRIPMEVSRRFSSQIDGLVYAVRQFEQGNLDYVVPETDDLEFSLVANHLNAMTGEIKELISTNVELADLNRKIEYHQLETQFNPHFINNVLETIRVITVLDPDRIPEIIARLAAFLRYSANHTLSIVPLQDDVAHTADYLYIQEYRFQERLSYEINMEPETRSLKVPKLLIQPLVENSIKHGLEKNKRIHVSICARMENDHLIIHVRDDGRGMTSETLAKVNAVLNSTEPVSSHIGIYNINRRLVLLYGKEYSLKIFSDPEHGTVTVIRIPAGEG